MSGQPTESDRRAVLIAVIGAIATIFESVRKYAYAKTRTVML
jgi:hypothetical protein